MFAHPIHRIFVPSLLVLVSMMFNLQRLYDWIRPANLERAIARFETQFADVPNMSVGQWMSLSEEQRNQFVLVDVREDREIEVSIMPGAISFEDYLEYQTIYEGKTVLAYCTVGYRSSVAVQHLQANGVDAFNLRGGIIGWTQIGGPLLADGQSTTRVHTYARRWDYAPARYQSTW